MSLHLVTGATGAVGGAVTARLLRDASTRVVCLVRGASNDAARHRLEEWLRPHPDLAGVDDWAARVDVVTGDVQAPSLGLDASAYARVASTVDHVHHCAGVVRMNLPLADARAAAVGAAQNIVALLEAADAQGRPVKCEHVSTVGIGGRDVRLVPEAWVEGRRRFHNTYEQAKAEAEEVIRRAIDRGLSITVHRPSMVVGDARDGWAGQFQIFYHLVEFLRGTRTHGIFPRFGAARLDIVPANVVADAIVASSARPAWSGRVLNLCAGPGDAIRLGRLQELVHSASRRHGERLPRAYSVAPWALRAAARVASLVVDARTRRVLATLPVFLDYLASEQSFANDRTRRDLAAAGVALVPIETFVPRVLDFYLAARHAPVPRPQAG